MEYFTKAFLFPFIYCMPDKFASMANGGVCSFILNLFTLLLFSCIPGDK